MRKCQVLFPYLEVVGWGEGLLPKHLGDPQGGRVAARLEGQPQASLEDAQADLISCTESTPLSRVENQLPSNAAPCQYPFVACFPGRTWLPPCSNIPSMPLQEQVWALLSWAERGWPAHRGTAVCPAGLFAVS